MQRRPCGGRSHRRGRTCRAAAHGAAPRPGPEAAEQRLRPELRSSRQWRPERAAQPAPAATAETTEAPAEAAAPPPPAQAEAPLREQQLDKFGRAYATGRRKDAVARVWLKPGSGKIEVNGRDQEVYFARPTLRLVINQPFDITDRKGQYDVVITVKGGGLSGQAGAVKHGIAQALSRFEPALRTAVKQAGFLTRDPRVVERKKYGRAKARRSFQFSKR